MNIDFYQLAGTPLEQVISSLGETVLAAGGRLLIVSEDEAFLTRLDRRLWDDGPTNFLPHGLAGGPDDSRQPILLSTSPDAPNEARAMLIADGIWREAVLSFDQGYYLFDNATLDDARLAWKLLAGRDGIERQYWAFEDGCWARKR